MLVAFVQGVIGAFDEDFGPFNKRSGKKTGKSADQDFLEERGMHPSLTATMVPVSKLFAEDADPAIITIH